MATAKFDDEEFTFPDEVDAKKSTEEKIDIEIEDDTPSQDRGRKPMKEPVDEVTDEELASYDEKVQKRIKKFTRGFHDERRAKEEALREREAAVDFAKQVYEENKRLQQRLSTGSEAYIAQTKSAAQVELESAKEKLKKAHDSADTDGIVAAQEAITKAAIKAEQAQNMRPVRVEEKQFKPPVQ